MSPRRNPRLAYCEYVSPDPNGSTAVWMARLELMRAVRQVYPTMLKCLAAHVFPAYVELAESGFKFDAILWHPRLSPCTMIPRSGLKLALSEWATKFHAESGWFLDEVVRTLRGWYVAPEWRGTLRWNPIGGVTSTLAMGECFQFDCEGWEMQLLTWAAYSQSVRERLDLKLAEYEAASRKLAESRGLVRAPHKYSPLNLEWFVLYQFAGRSSTQIADRQAKKHDPVDDSTVLKGIKTAAKLVAWHHLRPTHRRQNRKIR